MIHLHTMIIINSLKTSVMLDFSHVKNGGFPDAVHAQSAPVSESAVGLGENGKASVKMSQIETEKLS